MVIEKSQNHNCCRKLRKLLAPPPTAVYLRKVIKERNPPTPTQLPVLGHNTEEKQRGSVEHTAQPWHPKPTEFEWKYLGSECCTRAALSALEHLVLQQRGCHGRAEMVFIQSWCHCTAHENKVSIVHENKRHLFSLLIRWTNLPEVNRAATGLWNMQLALSSLERITCKIILSSYQCVLREIHSELRRLEYFELKYTLIIFKRTVLLCVEYCTQPKTGLLG